MLRRQIRDGVRAVARGEDPPRMERLEGRVITTHTQDTVLRIPALPDLAADRRLLRETGRRVVAGEYATPARA